MPFEASSERRKHAISGEKKTFKKLHNIQRKSCSRVILTQCSISIPTGNVRKPKIFWRFLKVQKWSIEL